MTKQEVKGSLLGILSAVIGGVCPVYWRQIDAIHPVVILFYRVVLVCAFTFLVSVLRYGWEGVIAPLRRKGAVRRFALTGVVMVSNWGVYVWAVNSGHIVQTSIGYFIVPIMVCLIGIVVFHEKVNRQERWGLAIVGLGVAALVAAYGEFPAIAFAVALTYSSYTSAQKTAHVSGILAMFYQTLFLAPFFLAAVLAVELTGRGAFAVASPMQLLLLSFAGVVTAMPLILLLNGINCAPLVIMGLTSYIGNAITMLIGLLVYHETVTPAQLSALCVVWVGIAVFTAGGVCLKKQNKERN